MLKNETKRTVEKVGTEGLNWLDNDVYFKQNDLS